jgi:uncharacterized membrane protein HdeD (DUF308 family)
MLSPVMSSRSLIVRGTAALILGVIAFLLSGSMFVGLALVFGIYAIANGISALASAMRKGTLGRGWLFVEAVISIFLGTLTFVHPVVAILGLTYLIGAWAVLSGGLQIGEAFVLRRYLPHETLYLLSGVLTLLFGFLILSTPLIGNRTAIFIFAIYGVVFGISSLIAGAHVGELEANRDKRDERRAA